MVTHHLHLQVPVDLGDHQLMMDIIIGLVGAILRLILDIMDMMKIIGMLYIGRHLLLSGDFCLL